MKISAWRLTAAIVLGTASARNGVQVSMEKALRADSSAGRKLLNNAVVLKPSEEMPKVRRTENYEGYQYGDNQYGLSDLANMYILYKGCTSFMVPDQDGNGSGDGNNINYYNYQQEGYNYNNQQNAYQAQQQGYNYNNAQQDENGNVYYNDGMIMQNLVTFTLCSDSSCGSCSGEYASDMTEFLNAYTEMQMREDEYQCEYVREHCYCQNGNNEYCYSTCYANAGLDTCMQEYYGQEAFQLQEYIECQAAYGNNNNNNNGGSAFYVGPYCAESEYVYLGAFYDEDCTYQADSDTFNSMNYGDGFPYFDTPIISGSDCVSCMDVEEGNAYHDDQYYQPEANELCERATEEAIKCDSDRGYYSGCTFLKKTLPCLAYGDCPSDGDTKDSTSGWFDTVSHDRYQDMVDQMMRNRKAAFILGALAGALVLGIFVALLSCMCAPPRSLYLASAADSDRRLSLLKK